VRFGWFIAARCGWASALTTSSNARRLLGLRRLSDFVHPFLHLPGSPFRGWVLAWLHLWPN